MLSKGNTTRPPTIFHLLIVSCFLVPLGATPKTPLCEKHRHWLEEEVPYIIADRERKEFKALTSESERDAFIERFWAIRDPDGSTEENEFKIEHYRRIAHANKVFHDGIPGWKTARGRVYIIHGPPDDVNFSFGSDRIAVDIRKPTEVLTGGSGDSGQFFRITLTQPETEIWMYRHLDGARNYPEYFEVVFSRVEPSNLYAVNQTIRGVGEGINLPYAARVLRDSAISRYAHSQPVGGEYRILYAGAYKFPDVQSLFQSIFHPYRVPSFDISEIQLGLSDLERSSGEALYERLDRERALRQQVKANISFEPFQMDLTFGSVRSNSGGTMLPLTVGVGREFVGDTLDLLVELVRPDGTSAASLTDSLRLDRDEGTAAEGSPTSDGEFLYLNRLAAKPGDYRLLAYGRLRNCNRTALVEKDIRLPDYRGPDMQMSDILLFDKVVRADGFESHNERARFVGGSNPIRLRDVMLVPAADRRFRRADRLNAFVEVYNPGIAKGAGEPSLDLQCRLLRGGQVVASLPQKLLDYTTDAKNDDDSPRTTYGLSIPLAFLYPGDYDLELQVRDEVRGQAVSKRMPFRVD